MWIWEIYLELSNVPGHAGGKSGSISATLTRVIVKNGQTIVLAGILKIKNDHPRNPLLMDIPWLGELFKSRETASTAANWLRSSRLSSSTILKRTTPTSMPPARQPAGHHAAAQGAGCGQGPDQE
jgi:hypothetical protein